MWIRGPVSEQKSIRNFDLIDIAKFIGCFFIISAHTGAFADTCYPAYYLIVKCFAHVFVVFYFVASGFLLFGKMDENSPDIRIPVRYAVRIFKIYVLWTIIYLPIICYSALIADGGILAGVREQIWAFLFSGSATQLWYLNALVYCTLIIALLLRLRAGKYAILAISAVFYLAGIMNSAQGYFSALLPEGSLAAAILNTIFSFRYLPHRALTKGLFPMSLGMVLAWSRVDIQKKKAYWGLAAAAAIFLAESVIPLLKGHKSNDGLYFFIVPVAYAACYIMVKTAIPHKARYVWYRNMSSLIFYIHVFVLTFFRKILEFIDAAAGTGLNNGMVRFIGTSLISFAFAAIVLKLSEKEKYSFLKVLYTGTWKKRKET